MKKKIAEKWVKALRSGEYKKTEGALRNDEGFCCLGVLCNLHAQAHPKIAREQSQPRFYLGESAILPLEVRDWAMMDNGEGSVADDLTISGNVYESLVDANDSGVSFKKIANWIEKNYKEL